MQRILKYIISENTTPVTILDFLKKEGFSRHILSSMKNTPNTIILNGERGFGRSVLKPQDHLIITVPETESGENKERILFTAVSTGWTGIPPVL